jgi:hypothetical protein
VHSTRASQRPKNLCLVGLLATKQPKTQELQVSRLLNGAHGATSQIALGRVPTPRGRPPPRWGGQSAALGHAAAHRGVSSPRAVWTSVPCTQWADLAHFDGCGCGGGMGAPGPVITHHAPLRLCSTAAPGMLLVVEQGGGMWQ